MVVEEEEQADEAEAEDEETVVVVVTCRAAEEPTRKQNLLRGKPNSLLRGRVAGLLGLVGEEHVLPAART